LLQKGGRLVDARTDGCGRDRQLPPPRVILHPLPLTLCNTRWQADNAADGARSDALAANGAKPVMRPVPNRRCLLSLTSERPLATSALSVLLYWNVERI